MSDNSVATPAHLLQAKVIFLSFLLTGGFVATYSAFNRHLRQITSVHDIPTNVFRRKYLYGKVTSVGDGDNFLFFHTPGGVLGGWHWLRKVPTLQRKGILPRRAQKATGNALSTLSPLNLFRGLVGLRSEGGGRDQFALYRGRRKLPTLSIRLCGVDAPERAHFGNSSQPLSEEAYKWLNKTLLGRFVWVKPLSTDQYGRCVAKVEYWSWFRWKNVSIELLKQGLGVVYESKSGAEFDGQDTLYRYHESKAKKSKRGVWGLRHFETPGAYKKRINKQ
ncbi:AFL066Cp [Eremothecium gossypii ATCC 10895]|uniref:Probable endonuclease LCL3 n=1 Tax=Eremothecium gossypii (strain ATCC 10895 / CBS 109.51 / FGSC 9923 / NRRL Y-1056) TaxID=284811 RepID=LCL3_EREGS|nr:AFL066Cp [Eremothecium gossypii ATCC 10895]Q754Z2.1 RecName: Full=Probable endonuclease LCL3 [Eremothecium gossypii ATCC 10895]AAS53306.1 AFL066Cp [Eremothecium gossypii ATCC 10895]AEY97617.1 FAFL066Cp [Eremothecium gossypii FDAG1]